MNYRNRFVVEPGAKVRLGKIDPGFKDQHEESHDSATPEIQKPVERMAKAQYLCTPTAASHYWSSCKRSTPAARTAWCATCSPP